MLPQEKIDKFYAVLRAEEAAERDAAE